MVTPVLEARITVSILNRFAWGKRLQTGFVLQINSLTCNHSGCVFICKPMRVHSSTMANEKFCGICHSRAWRLKLWFTLCGKWSQLAMHSTNLFTWRWVRCQPSSKTSRQHQQQQQQWQFVRHYRSIKAKLTTHRTQSSTKRHGVSSRLPIDSTRTAPTVEARLEPISISNSKPTPSSHPSNPLSPPVRQAYALACGQCLPLCGTHLSGNIENWVRLCKKWQPNFCLPPPQASTPPIAPPATLPPSAFDLGRWNRLAHASSIFSCVYYCFFFGLCRCRLHLCLPLITLFITSPSPPSAMPNCASTAAFETCFKFMIKTRALAFLIGFEFCFGPGTATEISICLCE